MSESVAILGAGNMGTALAQVIATNGHKVRLWSIEHDVLEEVRDKHLNTRYLDDVRLNDRVEAVWEMRAAVEGARLIIVSVPSQVVHAVASDLAGVIKPGQLVLNVAKGLESGSHRRMSEVISAELPDGCGTFVGSMGGPAIANEMARGQPMAVIAHGGEEFLGAGAHRRGGATIVMNIYTLDADSFVENEDAIRASAIHAGAVEIR